jgi:tetratricopeptide (TPR) repeat protein
MNSGARPNTWQSGQIPLSILGVLALTLVLRLLHLSSAVISPLSFQLGADEDYYFRFGRAVAAGVGQVSPEFTFMDPGYGYLLGGLFKLVGSGVFAVYLLQCLVDGLTTLAVVTLGRQLGRPRAGAIGGVLYALSSTAIMFCCSLLKEVWVAALMTWWVVIALHLLRSERKLGWLGFGVFCGVAVAFRSTLVLLALAALVLPWVSGPILNAPLKHRAVRTAMVAIGLMLALAPWSLRNFEAYHSLSPLPHNGGVVLHQAYNSQNPESSIWIPEFVNYLNPSEIWRGYAAEAERRVGHELAPPQVDEYWRSQAEEFMRRHPGAVAEDVGRKTLKFFASADIPINRSLEEEGLFSFVMARLPAAAPWLLALGLAGLIWLGVEDRRWIVVAVPPAIALLTTALFWAEDRFRFHAFATLAFCSGIWVDAMLCRIQSRSYKPAIAFGAAAVALVSASFALGAGVNTPPLHWDQIVWGYIKMGRLKDAEATAARASRDQPENAQLLEAQAYLAVRRQDYTVAAEAYEHALRIRSRSDQAHYNLAKVYMMLNKRDEALTQAKIAMDLKPDPDYQELLAELQRKQ